MTPEIDKIDLSSYEVVFCDSREALDILLSQGLNPRALVRTLSPNLLRNGVGDLEIEAMEAPVAGARLRAFKKALRPFSEEIYDLCQGHDKIREFATTIARQAVASQRVTLNAACLSSDDFLQPRLLVQLRTAEASVDQLLNGPWGVLLSENRQAKSVIVDIQPSASLDLASPLRLRRWMHQGVEYLGYRAGLLLSAWAPWMFKNGKVALVLKENELLFETAFHLARNGIRLQRIANAPPAELTGGMDAVVLKAHLGETLKRFAARFVCEAAIDPCVDEAIRRICEAVGRQATAKVYWAGVLSENRQGGVEKILLTNYPGRPEDGGLFDVCNASGIPMIAFQHGVSREVNAAHGDVAMENAVAHLTLVYNDAARERSDETPFYHWPSLSVGFPTIGRRISRLPALAFEKTQPIFYVSTAVCAGYRHMVTTSLTDAQMYDTEIGIIRNVLGPAPYGVTYKPYPYLNRYADEDPVLAAAMATPNISVVTKNVDMRYQVGSAKIIITGRATSTAGWCLMSKKPLCFLDVPGQMPLREDVRAAFDEALFLFDTSDPDFQRTLLEFLSQPLADIENQWMRKAKARQTMLRQFIDMPVKSTGRTAAGYILEHCFKPDFFDRHQRRGPNRISAEKKQPRILVH